MDSDYASWQEMEAMNTIKVWWWNLVASGLIRMERETHALFLEKCDQLLKIQAENRKLLDRISELEQPSRLGSWIASRFDAAEERKQKLEESKNLLRDALRNEKAYTLFLEDCLECENPSVVFNALPLEKRKEYFDRIQ